MATAAIVLGMTACGGSSDSSSTSASSDEATETEEDEVKFADRPVELSDWRTTFYGNGSELIELVAGIDTIKQSEYSEVGLSVVVKAKVLKQSDEEFSKLSLEVKDESSHTIGEFTVTGGTTELYEAMGRGDTESEIELTFSLYCDSVEQAKTIMTTAKEIVPNRAEIKEVEVASGEYSCMPATMTVDGPLSQYVRVRNKPHIIKEGSGLGAHYYVLTFDFDVLEQKKFTEEIIITATLYDENGNEFSLPGKYGPITTCDSFSDGFLQVALSEGRDCNRTSVLIRTDAVENFDPSILSKIKTFKVHSKLYDGTEFDYTSDTYRN